MGKRIINGCCSCGSAAILERSKPKRGYYQCQDCGLIYRVWFRKGKILAVACLGTEIGRVYSL